MSIEFLWQLPAGGDGRALSREQWRRGDHLPAAGDRPAFARTGVRRDGYTWYDYLAQVARAAELSGFDGVVIPQTAAGEEPWMVAGALVRETKRLKFVPALPAPFLSAVYAAKMAISFQRLSGGRLGWQLVAQEPETRAWHGQRWPLAEQLARTDEFLDVVKGVWNQPPFTYHGRYYEVENGGFSPALAQRARSAETLEERGPVRSEQPLPTIYASGESEAELALGAKHADVYVLPLDTPAATGQRIARLQALAAAQGRRLRFAVQAEVVARHDGLDAWRELRRRWDEAHAKAVSIDGAAPPGADDFDVFAVDARIWSGFGRVRPGAPAGLVGSYEELAERLLEYALLGVDSFALAAHPHLEEAYHLGTQLLPRVRDRISAARRAG